MTAPAITPQYAFVLFEAVALGLQLLLIGFSIGSLRKKLFNKKFFEDNFPELKGDDSTKFGYPDMGNGRYSAKLTLEQWREFNNAQRAHYNFLEMFIPAVLALLVSGLFYVRLAIVGGAVLIVSRVIYTAGYKTKGPKGRTLGAILYDIPMLVLIIASLYGCWQWGGGLSGLLEVIADVQQAKW